MVMMRALALVLVALVGAGTLLDSCVLGCHSHAHAQAPQPDQQGSAHCHDSLISSDQSGWQATSTCSHDHGELSADVGSQPRSSAGLKAMSLAVSLRPVVPASDQRFVWRPAGGADIHRPLHPATFLSPLRL